MDVRGVLRTIPREIAEQADYERYIEACRVVEVIERSNGRTDLKYMMASQVLSGRMFDKGSAPLQDVLTLFDLRNMIMHLKPVAQNIKLVNGNRIFE